MALMLRYDSKNHSAYSTDQSTIDILRNGFIGDFKNGRLSLIPEEALYLMDVRNSECVTAKGKYIDFVQLAHKNRKSKKFMARYFTYKDWRDRGLIIVPPWRITQLPEEKRPISVKTYPAEKLKLKKFMASGIFFPYDMVTIIKDESIGKYLYDTQWFGQYGTYKLADHGSLNKLDIYETLFLMDSKRLSVEGYSRSDIIKAGVSMRDDFRKLYSVYKDWRKRGYVVKTGFKFGTHFRIYFPGANPTNQNSEWVHSRHVLHVFPRNSKLLISEWARAIRVAHSVRKTFILAIPGKSRAKKLDIDFILYHREKGKIEDPKTVYPKYSMLSLSENEYIGGSELSAIISKSQSINLELIIAIMDRETAVTYYKVRKINLPMSRYEYYEIDWMQP
ncbi:tRNA splicing endonuclease [Candidatus Mancarchaeum acidiphilum]|uniref:tRNA splicing endonuclease n=1 Tax=Candidatus Mancarchaeum acidiphilum TaxID=1920749 RepID=A0A218NLN1_9ARCH|nr:tRNA-intron lyase [Candidatus Mancarchaeum acidiphilum]ASI13352.1 tRNA splicing endonuclease [Candidatus Mancarchaeum acidiphilum]